MEFGHLHMAEIPDGKSRSDDLACHSGDRRAHHPPAENVDADGVQNDVGEGPCQSGRHGKARAAVGADDRVHGLAKHIKGNAQGDPEEILLGAAEGLLIDPTAKQSDDGVLENQIDCGHSHAGQNTENHRAADALVRILLTTGPQADTDKSTAAIANHDSQRQRHHRHGEHNGVGRIAIGAQIRCVGDKNLVHHIVKCCHQQRDDAGDGVFSHQLPDFFGPQKRICIGFFHKTDNSFHAKTKPAHGPGLPRWTAHWFLLMESSLR